MRMYSHGSRILSGGDSPDESENATPIGDYHHSASGRTEKLDMNPTGTSTRFRNCADSGLHISRDTSWRLARIPRPSWLWSQDKMSLLAQPKQICRFSST